MGFIKEKLKKWNWFYTVQCEIRTLIQERKNLWAEAVTKNEEEHPEGFNLHDYKRALRRHRISFHEFCTYEFWHLTEKERDNYLSEKELKCIYRKIIDVDTIKQFDNKLTEHLRFEKFMHRAWLCPILSSFTSFCQFVTTHDCIVKPYLGSLGQGVFMIRQNEAVDLKELYDNCCQSHLIVEERVRAHSDIEEFHPQSLNTIRIMSMSKGDKFGIISCEIRMGIGKNVVDNAATGGILAPIDPNTGLITDDGKDTNGHVYVTHPDTGKVIKGFVIPYWDKVIAACKEMTTYAPNAIFAGWDLCVLNNGEIEMIEVNSAAHIMGLQVSHGCGLRPRIQALGKEILGYDLTKLIPVWSQPYVNLFEKKQYKHRHKEDSNLLLKEFISYSSSTIQ